MTNKDSLSHAACKRTDTFFSNLTEPNFSLQLAPLAVSIFDQFSSVHSFFHLWPILMLFMTCAAKRGSQLSNRQSSAIGTPVLCSTEIFESSALSSHFSDSHLHTTIGHVITLKWSLRNHFHSHTCVNQRVLKCFRTRFIIVFQNDASKNKIFDEIDKKWDEVCCGIFPFATRHSRLTMSVVSTNHNWKCVCILLRQENAIKSHHWGLFVLFLLPPSVQLRCCPPTPQPSTQAAHKFL